MAFPLALTGILASYIAGETLSLGVERLIIKDPNLPPAFHNLRVCFISDIHHGRYSSVRRLKQMVKKINQLQPDLFLLGGDYLQTSRRNKLRLQNDVRELTEILANVKPPTFGSYAVLGNHDYQLPLKFFRQEFARAGITLLHNEGAWLKKDRIKIYLGGIGDLWFGQPNFKQTTKGVKPQDFQLLLSHQPNFIDELTTEDGVNFVFAGHTHGSQITVFHYVPVMLPKIARWQYTVGLVETPQTRMLVSPGIGTRPPYFRFASPPKIHLLVFKSAPRISAFTAN
jgi:predicted MPP superfamily phosphohydrolase